MKSTTNVFLDGLITDRHPLSTPQNCLTDALNATLLTYNGNEMMLQNDMGNTRILDSATGNIMSLSPGFIPVGMKEHGGIMYIASVNKEGEGEIGTIPSPIIRNFYKGKLLILIDRPLSDSSYVPISNKIYPADKIMINLGMTVDPKQIVGSLYEDSPTHAPINEKIESIDPCDYYVLRKCIIPPYQTYDVDKNSTVLLKSITSPIISYSPDAISEFTYNKGIFKLKLSSKSITNADIEAKESLYQSQLDSKYWFYHTTNISNIFPSDLFEATLSKDLKSYPTDSKPGYLQVKLLKEGIKSFGMLQRDNTPFDTPFTIKISKSEYETYFPGFYYTTESGIYVSKIECSVVDLDAIEKRKEIILSNGDKYLSAEIYFDQLPELSSDISIKNVIGFTEKSGKNIDYNLLTPIINISKTSISYPLIYDKNTNCFYLTNITNIEDIHTKYKSTSIQKDGNVLPYSGLFKILLDDTTIKHWHKLNVVYYNLYGEKLGNYECVFNPYLNDVFGSNVTVTNVSYADFKKMGADTPVESKTLLNVESGAIISFKSETGYVDLEYEGNNPNSDDVIVQKDNPRSYRDASDSPLIFVDDDLPQDNWYENLWTKCPLESGDVVFLISKDQLSEIEIYNNNLSYLYDDKYDTLNYSFIPSSVNFNISNSVLPSYIDFINLPRLWYSMWNLDDLDEETGTVSSPDFANSWEADGGYHNDLYSTYVYLKMDDNDIKKIQYKIQWASGTTTYEDFPLYADKTEISDLSIIWPELNGSISIADSEILSSTRNFFTISCSYNPINLVFSQLEKMKLGFDRDFLAMKYTAEKSDKLDIRIKLSFEVKGTKKVILPQLDLKSLYKITPYFLLLNDDVYVSKLHLTDDVFYECNFQTSETDNIPINYLTNRGNYLFSEDTVQDYDGFFSYCLPTHKSLIGEGSITPLLDPGIYVFNVSLPSIQYKGCTSPEISIGINGKTESHSPNRWTGSSQMNASWGEYGMLLNHLWPIVIIVRETSKVTITIKPDTNNFYYQKEGLYKLKNIDEIDSNLSDAIGDNNSYLFYEYQNIILDISDNIEDLETKNTFIQTYGIFFRLAYSYVEGLHNPNCADNTDEAIESITIGGVSYAKKPFIPEEPYIINYMWDITPPLYIENKTCSAACLYCQPKNVLSNRSDTTFKFFPNIPSYDNNLTNQVLLYVFSDTNKIKCKPSKYTKLIKSNDDTND